MGHLSSYAWDYRRGRGMVVLMDNPLGLESKKSWIKISIDNRTN